MQQIKSNFAFNPIRDGIGLVIGMTGALAITLSLNKDKEQKKKRKKPE